MVMEGDQTAGGEHTTDNRDVVRKSTPEIYDVINQLPQ